VILLLFIIIIIRPQNSTTYVELNYCYRRSSVVCLSLCRSVCHDREPCKNRWTDGDAIWAVDSGEPKEPRIRWGSISRSSDV